MDLQLAGKRAVVTGGSRGIGRAIAATLAQEGATVAIVARSIDALQAAADEIVAASGAKVFAIAGDSSDDASVAAAVRQAHDLMGGVDILVNNAASPGGLAARRPSGELDLNIVGDDVNVKVLGYLRFIEAVAPLMSAQQWGRIISVGGAAIRQTGAMTTSLRNAAIVAMSKNLADELGAHGITVNTVHPSMTRTERDIGGRTPRNAIGRIVDASEIAPLVAFLASPLSAAITGESIACGGGIPGGINY